MLGIINQNTIECIGHRTNLVAPEFAPSTGFSTSECETSLWASLTSPSGCETRRKKWVKNTVDGYPICNNDFATVEKPEVSSIASYEKTLIQLANADFEIEGSKD
ncbi:hypothetical protein BYT27DRAFT_7214680 [Phlegmacium glaucopus]|nr:hypothetical protein BYT27DRAFT_7214680 [Phlegmacium glaucopus]